MQSSIQVEQIIGRVLRQPDAQHYESEARGDNGDNVGGGDAKALVQQRVGEEANSDGLTAGWDTLKDGNDSLNWPHFAP